MAGLAGGDEGHQAIERFVPGTNIQADDDPAFEDLLGRQQPGIRSLLAELAARLRGTEVVWASGYPIAGDDESGHAEALAVAERADLVVMTLGGKHGTSSIASMGEGIDATNINLPPCQERLIEKLARLGKPLVGVHLDGRPVSSDAADRHLGGLLEAWSPAERGAQAIVDVLLGEVDPSGRLPVSVARSAGQIPVYYNHPYGSSWHQGGSVGFREYVDAPHTPRYPFGHGLSYTEFEYTSLDLSAPEVAPDGELDVAVRVGNVGARTASETVQLYARDRYASMSRPVLELVGFRRILLRPGEEKVVRFTFAISQMAFLDTDMRWLVEAGDIDILAGASSADLRLSGVVRVTAAGHVDGRTRGFFARSHLG
jgi:beta-glucosidase